MTNYVLHFEDKLYRREGDGPYEKVTATKAIALLKKDEVPQLRLTDDIPSRSFVTLVRNIVKNESLMDRLVITVSRAPDLSTDADTEGIISRRWCRGKTRSLYRFIASGTYEDFLEHPAYDAVAYLSLQGADAEKLQALIRRMSDIAVPHALFRGSRRPIDRMIDTVSSVPPAMKMFEECECFQTGDRSASPWLDALVPESAMGQIGDIKPATVIATWKSALRLIFGQWLAAEYHPDLMSEANFTVSRQDQRVHSGYQQWKNAQSGN